MLAKLEAPPIPLPKGWQGCVKSAVANIISLAHYAIVYARAWAADSINARVRLAAENDPPDIISHTIWLYHRFTLSVRDIEDVLAERGPWCRMSRYGDGA